MGNKRVSRTDDSQYWNDPDYQEALVEFGLGPSLSSKFTPTPAPPTAALVVTPPVPAEAPQAACIAAADVAAAPSGPSFWTSLIALPFQIIEYVVMAITVLLEILAGWAGFTPIIWICNLFFHTKIPGIEVPIIFLIGYLVKGFFQSLGWWVGN
jgi:hypothetical protein